MSRKLTRREWLEVAGKGALAISAVPLVGFAFGRRRARNRKLAKSEDAFLERIERAAFDFFWEQASPATGQVKDRALADGSVDKRKMASIAATGFGLTGLAIADSRSYRRRSDLTARVIATLKFLLQSPNEHGFLYHFGDMETGEPAHGSEVSSIDTAILLCGVLTARAHFRHDEITKLASQFYERVDFPWMMNGGETLTMGWKPESGFIRSRWDTYSELMMLYLLAIGSPTHPIPASSWNAFARPWFEYGGMRYINGNAPIFIHQYSHAWFDFRDRHDAHADYFANSVLATRAHRLFCASLHDQFHDYSDDLWGITASDSEHGYVAWGGPPKMGPIDGTIVPCASAGSLPFLPDDCLAVLQNIEQKFGKTVWTHYGFADAFNPLNGWVDPDVIGIDLGISMLMAENLRSGFVWDTFMKNPEARQAMTKVGFASDAAPGVK